MVILALDCSSFLIVCSFGSTKGMSSLLPFFHFLTAYFMLLSVRMFYWACFTGYLSCFRWIMGIVFAGLNLSIYYEIAIISFCSVRFSVKFVDMLVCGSNFYVGRKLNVLTTGNYWGLCYFFLVLVDYFEMFVLWYRSCFQSLYVKLKLLLLLCIYLFFFQMLPFFSISSYFPSYSKL